MKADWTGPIRIYGSFREVFTPHPRMLMEDGSLLVHGQWYISRRGGTLLDYSVQNCRSQFFRACEEVWKQVSGVSCTKVDQSDLSVIKLPVTRLTPKQHRVRRKSRDSARACILMLSRMETAEGRTTDSSAGASFAQGTCKHAPGQSWGHQNLPRHSMTGVTMRRCHATGPHCLTPQRIPGRDSGMTRLPCVLGTGQNLHVGLARVKARSTSQPKPSTSRMPVGHLTIGGSEDSMGSNAWCVQPNGKSRTPRGRFSEFGIYNQQITRQPGCVCAVLCLRDKKNHLRVL